VLATSRRTAAFALAENRTESNPSIFDDCGASHSGGFCFLGDKWEVSLNTSAYRPPTTTVTSTFEELSKPNPLLEAMRQPPPIMGVHARTQIAESNSLLGTISATGPQITERSATDDFVTVTVQRVPTKKQIAITISPETGQ